MNLLEHYSRSRIFSSEELYTWRTYLQEEFTIKGDKRITNREDCQYETLSTVFHFRISGLIKVSLLDHFFSFSLPFPLTFLFFVITWLFPLGFFFLFSLFSWLFFFLFWTHCLLVFTRYRFFLAFILFSNGSSSAELLWILRSCPGQNTL